MSINLLFTQIPLVGEISGAMQAAPEAQQSMLRQAANASTELRREQVQQAEKQDGANAVDARSGGRGQQQQAGKRRKKKSPEEKTEQQSPKTAFAGNLINTRV